jgi:hypothetical protein
MGPGLDTNLLVIMDQGSAVMTHLGIQLQLQRWGRVIHFVKAGDPIEHLSSRDPAYIDWTLFHLTNQCGINSSFRPLSMHNHELYNSAAAAAPISLPSTQHWK